MGAAWSSSADRHQLGVSFHSQRRYFSVGLFLPVSVADGMYKQADVKMFTLVFLALIGKWHCHLES